MSDVPAEADTPAERIAGLGRRAAVLAAAPAALVALLALPLLGRRPYWLDESVSVTMAQLPWGEFADVVTEREPNMSLYHLLLRGWILPGDAEAWTRSFSLLAAAGAAALTALAGRRLLGPHAGLAAGVLLAANPVTLHYAAEARGYALALLLVAASTYLLVRALDTGETAAWAGYAAVAALAVYAHLFALFVVVAQAAAVVVRGGPLRRPAAAALGVGVGLVPLVLLVRSAGSSGIDWAAGNAAGRAVDSVRDALPRAAELGLVALGAAVALAVVVALRGRPPGGWPLWLGLLGVAVPIGAVTAVSFVDTPLFVIRYFVVVLPAAALLGAALLARGGGWALALGSAAVVGATVVLALAQPPGETEAWDEAASYVAARAEPEDGVLFYAPYVRIPFQLYLPAEARATVEPLLPASQWGEGFLGYLEFVAVDEARVAEAAEGRDAVWLVLSHEALYGDVDEEVGAVRRGLSAQGLVPRAERRLEGVTVVRYARAGGGS